MIREARARFEWPAVFPGYLVPAVSFTLVVALAITANRLTIAGRAILGRELIEYPLWAVLLGLLANGALGRAGLRPRFAVAFRTELFLKTGLVILGATIDFGDVLRYGVKGLVQATVLVSAVFFFTWYAGRVFRLEDKLRALLAAAVSICGVSAAIAAAGAVVAKKEQLAYVSTLVILFALPSMILQPMVAKAIGLPPMVAGAWIGGNIDTTAAVVGAGAVHSETAMKVASIAKLSQNALIGIAAFLLALYWIVSVERRPDERPRVAEIWQRFPKFVLGFAAASLLTTAAVSLGYVGPAQMKALTGLRNWAFTLAFVSIGLEVMPDNFLRLGARPVAVYALATAFNLVVALGVAWIVFGSAVGW